MSKGEKGEVMNDDTGYLLTIRHNEEVRREVGANRLGRRLTGRSGHVPKTFGAWAAASAVATAAAAGLRRQRA